MYGYGGFNVASVPGFPGPMAAFVGSGGVFVHAHLRGGGELGLDWWRQGRRANKQQSYDDLYAVAEDLVARGITSTDQLAVVGSSNGGLLAAAAATQRPDLWRAAVPRVPVTDLLGGLRDPYLKWAIESEFVDPGDPDGRSRLVDVSPYHLATDGVRYPAVYIDAGDTDPRCPPWQARKLAARLQAATAGDAPILLHVWEQVGHGWATARDVEVTEHTEWLAFVMQHLGLAPRT
jgi:prolyl oligopeptidase